MVDAERTSLKFYTGYHMPGIGVFRRYDDMRHVWYFNQWRWSVSSYELQDSLLGRWWWHYFMESLYSLHARIDRTRHEVQAEILQMFSTPGVLDALDAERRPDPSQQVDQIREGEKAVGCGGQ